MFSLCNGEDVVPDEVCEWQPRMGHDGGVTAFNPQTNEIRCGDDALRVLGNLTPPWYHKKESVERKTNPRFTAHIPSFRLA